MPTRGQIFHLRYLRLHSAITQPETDVLYKVKNPRIPITKYKQLFTDTLQDYVLLSATGKLILISAEHDKKRVNKLMTKRKLIQQEAKYRLVW
ncbi:unnamed protein product [Leptosia nina]|uniref:Uncharacterized protein n=1 Tax=Leptosia nina TaxID=320188 RepID=A0AAV1K212_9NEOP